MRRLKRKTAIKNHKFNEKLITSEDALFINQILLDKCKMGVIHDTCYYYRQREDTSSTTDTFKNKKEYYNDQIKYFMLEIINYSKNKKGQIPKFIQYLVMYTLQWMFETPQINMILNKTETKELYALLNKVLQNIDDNIILEQKHIPETLKYHILHEKHGKFEKEIQYNTEHLKINNTLIDTLGVEALWIDIIEIKNNELYISGYLPSFFTNQKTQIKATNTTKNKKEEYTGIEIQYPKRNNFSLGKPVKERLHIDLHIPIEPNTQNTINFKVKHNIEVDLPIEFSMNAKLSKTSHYTRTTQKKHKLQYNKLLLKNIDNAIIIEPYTKKKYIKLELATLKKIRKTKKPHYKEAILLRTINFILSNTIYRNKIIWLFQDRQDTAKDNAEHLFKYSNKKKDKIKKYFIIKKQSNDYKKIKQHGKVINYGSLKHKILFLLADKIISSHPDNETLNPYWGEEIYLINGLLSSQYIFLQHGIINEDLSSWLKKADMNLTIFTCSAQKEYNSIFKYHYNYPKEVVQILGLPRYDLLENQEQQQNQILLMPSWRHQYNNLTDKEFKNTPYYKNYNKLINDKKLQKYLKEKNYKILFKPHYQMTKYTHLFNKNEQTIIEQHNKTEYTDAFNQSKLLITDNSSVFYDFAYLKKPTIYYHFKEDIPKFPEKPTEFNFQKDGFGEIIENHEQLIETIKKYIENDCKIKEKYKKRIEKFYTYHDKNNRKRNYNAIMKLYED